MKTKILILWMLLLTITAGSFAQNANETSKANLTGILSGKIMEESTGNGLEYANIVLFSLPDSTLVTGIASGEEGFFRLEKIKNGKYLLKISFIGFESRFVPVDVSADPVDLGDIQLKESNTLSEVVITAKVPTFQSGNNGEIIANVSATLLSTVGTANDVLQRMPGVAVDDDKISVFGKGSPIVYINNRKVQDSKELERLESSDISTVELITNPGAKYDAEGRAVLIIKTKKKMTGFSAQLTERLRQGAYSGDNENLNVSYTIKNLNLFATYYHNYRKIPDDENHFFTLKNEDGEWRHNIWLPYWYSINSQEVSTGFDYSLNDKHAIGGQYQFYTSKYNNPIEINTATNLNNVPYETSFSQVSTSSEFYQHLVNAFYNGEFNDRYSLRFDFDYMKNYVDRKQHTNETATTAAGVTESNTIDVSNQMDYDLYAGKLTNSYRSDLGLIEFGGEYNHIKGLGFVHSNGYMDNNDFTNEEQKAAGFVSYSHKFGVINVAAGLRYEYTSEQFTDSTKTVIIARKYSDFYPNISFSTNVKEANLSLSFSKRTQRPSFGQLNGNGVVYVNRFVSQKGNPYLNKSNIYSASFQAMLKPFYFDIEYVYIKKPVLLYLEERENNTNAILLSSKNFPKSQEINATFNFNHKMAFWQPNYTVGAGKPFFSAMYDGKEIAYNKVNYFFSAYNDFTLPLGIVLSGNFHYRSDKQDTFFESKSYRKIDAGLRKSFFDNTLRLNLMVYDIFNWRKERDSARLNNLQWNVVRNSETRYVTFSVTYIFNNYNKKYRGSSAVGDDLNRF